MHETRKDSYPQPEFHRAVSIEPKGIKTTTILGRATRYNFILGHVYDGTGQSRKNTNESCLGSSTEVQRPEGAAADINLHRRLADALKQAIDEYVTRS